MIQPNAESKFPEKTFFGRAIEFNQLKQVLYKVSNGTGHFVIVNGEAGTGKSLLVSKFKDYTAQVGAHFEYLRFSLENGPNPYQPFSQLIQNLQDTVPLSAANTGAENKSDDDEILNLQMLDTLQRNNKQIQQNILNALLEYSANKPLVIAVKDAHNASQSAWQFFHYLSDKVRDAKIMFIAGIRQDGVEKSEVKKPIYSDIISRMNRDGFIEKISLGRFSKEATVRWLFEMFEKTDFSGDFIDRLYKISGGVPGEILKYLKTLHETERLYCKNGIWFNDGHIDSSEILKFAQAETDIGKLHSQIEELSERQQLVLFTSALIYTPFDFHMISTLCGLSKIHLLQDLKRIEEKKLIIDIDDNQFQFKRTEIKVAIRDYIGKSKKEILHNNIAEALLASEKYNIPEYAHRVAFHFQESGKPDKAFSYYIKAGDLALQNFAFIEAREFFEKATSLFDLLTGAPASKDILHLLAQLAWLNRIHGNYDASLQNCDNALEIAAKENHERVANIIHIQKGSTYFRLNNWEKVSENLDACFEKLDELLPYEKAMAYFIHGNMNFELGHFTKAEEDFNKAREFAEKSSANSLLAMIFNSLGAVQNVLGKTMRAVSLYSQAIPILEEIDNASGLAQVYHNIGLTYIEEMNWEQANKFFGKSLSVTGPRNITPLKAITFLNRALSLTKLNELADAHEYSFKAIRLLESLNDELGIAEYHKIQGTLCAVESHWNKADEHFSAAIEMFSKYKNMLGVAETLLEMGLADMIREHKDAAVKHLSEAHQIFTDMNISKKAQFTQMKKDQINQKVA